MLRSRDLCRSLALFTVFASLPARSADAPEVPRLGEEVVPTSEAVHLTLDADKPIYTGTVRIQLDVRKKTDVFHLHSEGSRIESLKLSGSGGAVEATHEQVDPDRIRVTAPKKLETGAYVLEMAFTNDFDTTAVSLYRMEKDGKGYCFTQFEADDARGAFPCWDEPSFKIPYQLTLTVPTHHLAVSNTPAGEEKTASGQKTIVFQQTKPLPSYLIAFATGPLEVVPMPGLSVPGAIYTVSGQRHLTETAITMTPPLLKVLEEYFGGPYPFEKCDFIAVPEYWPGAMENPGAITFSDNVLLLDPKTATTSEKRRLARITAHELAHMWFGDLVTMAWWDDLWLNESFADWLGDKVTHQVFPEFDQNLSTIQDVQDVMRGDARSTAEPVRRPISDPQNLLQGVGVAYNKGKAVLRMFEQWTGEKEFQSGVRAYLEQHAWGTTVSADLWKALDKTSGKKVSEPLAGFIEQPGFPLLEVQTLEGGKVKLTQSRFHNYGTEVPPLEWKVPVVLKIGVGDKVETREFTLKSKSSTFDLGIEGTPDWIFPNAGAAGYYRWRLDPEPLKALAHRASATLLPAERIEIIGNASALLEAGALSGADYLGVLESFADDPEPLVMSSVLGALENVRTAFVTDDLGSEFASYIRRTLTPAAERFSLEKKAGEKENVSLLRSSLMAALGDEGRSEEVLGYASRLARNYLKSPGSVDASLVRTSLRLAAIGGDRALFDEYRQRLEAAKTPAERSHFLSSLGAFRSPALQDNALAYALSGSLRPQEIFALARGMNTTEEGRDKVFTWMTDQYEVLKGRVPPTFTSFMPSYAGGCSAERLEAARLFFSDPERSTPGATRQLEKVSESVHDCIGLREREGKAVAAYLRTLGAEP